MRRGDYLGSLIVRGTLINVGIDDNGQCYYYEYVDGGRLVERSCGTYCFDFIDCILSDLDYKGWTISVNGEEVWKEVLNSRKSIGLDPDDYEDYAIYDIKGMYDMFNYYSDEKADLIQRLVKLP